MNEKLKKVESYLSLILAIIAVIGWITTIVTHRVGTKKDIEALQTDVTEIKGNIETMSESQVESGKEDASTQTFMEQHMLLHESLH